MAQSFLQSFSKKSPLKSALPLFLALSLTILTTSPDALAQGGLPPLQGRVVTAPAGTFMSATLQTPISSEYSRPGDRFTAMLGSPVAGGDGIVLPAGSQLEGQVVTVRNAGRAGRNGELEVRFTGAITPNGQRLPLSARIQTEDGTGLIKGGSAAGRAGKAAMRTAVGAGSGAALGTAMGALSGGSVGRGAIYGTAIGGGLGLVAAGIKKGVEAILPAGQPVNIVLDTPITASAPMDGGMAAPMNYGNNYGGYNNGYNSNYNNGGYNTQPYNNGNADNNPYGNPYTQQNTQPNVQPNNYYGNQY